MSEPDAKVTHSRSVAEHAGVAAIVAGTELRNVRVDEVHAGPVGAVGPEMQIDVTPLPPQYDWSSDPEMLLVRVGHSLTCRLDESEGGETPIIVFHVAEFSAEPDLVVEDADLAAWIQTNAYFLVYPYVRQSLTALTAALGLPPLVLGYLRRDELPSFGAPAASQAGDVGAPA